MKEQKSTQKKTKTNKGPRKRLCKCHHMWVGGLKVGQQKGHGQWALPGERNRAGWYTDEPLWKIVWGDTREI